MDNNINRMTLYTIRMFYDNGHEEEFMRCKSPDEVRQAVFNIVNPLFKKEQKKLIGFKNDRTPIYETQLPLRSLENFNKGLKNVDFNALYWYIKDQKKPFILALLKAMVKKMYPIFAEPTPVVEEDDFIKGLEEDQKKLVIKKETAWKKL